MHYTTILLTVADTEREFDARVTAHHHRAYRSPDRTEPDEDEGFEVEDVEVELTKGTWTSILHFLSGDQVQAIEEEMLQSYREDREDHAYESWKESRYD